MNWPEPAAYFRRAATNPNPAASYTSPGRRRLCAAILPAVGPNTIPRRCYPDRADTMLRSRHDPRPLRAGCRPSATAATRHPVPPASDTGWPDDKAPSFPPPEAALQSFPKCSIRCDDDTRPPREMPPTIRNAASAQTRAHPDKIQGRAPRSATFKCTWPMRTSG